MAQLKDLIVTGASRFLGNIYGTLKGNADTATKATQDNAGQQIDTTYIKGLAVSGQTITYTKGDGTTGTIATQDTDTKVTQNLSTADGSFPILAANVGTSTTTTDISYFSTGVSINPYKKTINATEGSFKGMVKSGNWYQNIAEFESSITVDEIVIKTNIPFKNGHSMIPIYIKGYAYGEASPIDLTLAFYIYGDKFYATGCTSTCPWKPTIYLSTYIKDSTKYVAISLKKPVYFLRFSISILDLWYGASRPEYAHGWTFESQLQGDKETIIPQTDIVTIPYRKIANDISGNAETATKDGNGKVIASTYLPFTGGTMTGKITLDGDPTSNLHAATKQYVDKKANDAIAANDAMVYKGTIGSSGATVTALPATHNIGWTYKVITTGTYAGVACEIGDMIICITDGTVATDSHWSVVQTNIDGAVIGPSSSTTNAVAIFSNTSGKVIKNSGFTIGKSVPNNAVFTDTKVVQTATTADAEYALLATNTASPTETKTEGARYVSGVTINPSTKTITATNFRGDLEGTASEATHAVSADTASKIGTTTVGSTSKPVYINAGKPTAISGNIGSATKPVYISSGTITASNGTIGSGTKPIYMSSGTLTASSSTIGAVDQPVYMSAGIITACTMATTADIEALFA